MEHRNTVIAVLGIALLVLAAGCLSAEPSGEGRAVFTVTDAAADMGAVSQVNLTVDRVRVHSNASGWTTVSNEPQTYDLLALKASGTQKLLADVNLSAGNYTKMWLDVSNVVVVDDDGEHDATLPSGTLRMQGAFTVEPGATATATFDFVADRSLHTTGEGEYILAPVVRVETRSNAEVNVDAESNVNIQGGDVVTDVTVGMDENGNVGVNLRIPANAQLGLSAAGAVTFDGSGSGGAEARGSMEANASTG